MGERITRIKQWVNTGLHSARGKDVLLYLMFVCVAFVFWVLLSLDSELQRDYDVPVELEAVPDSVTLIGSFPSHFSAVVQAKGAQLLRFSWGKMPTMKVKFQDNVGPDHTVALSRLKIDGRLRDYFGQGVQLMSVKPDSVKITYTTNPGVKVKLNIVADIHPNYQCILSGPIRANVDSVKVYSTSDIPRTLTQVDTEPIVKSDLRDTVRYEVKIKPIAGMRIIPDRVIVTVPIEPLISKRRNVQVEVKNLPDDLGLITFPSRVDVSYLVPMSSYNDDFPLKAYVDFDELVGARSSSRIKVRLSLAPAFYHNIEVSPDSVEYIIEKHQ